MIVTKNLQEKLDAQDKKLDQLLELLTLALPATAEPEPEAEPEPGVD